MSRRIVEHEPMPRNMDSEYVLKQIEDLVSSKIGQFTGVEEPVSLKKVPEKVLEHIDADYGIQLAKVAGRSGWDPKELASELTQDVISEGGQFLESVDPHGPYLNLKLEIGAFGNRVLNQVLEMGSDYGKENIGQGRVVVIDMSSPNIAKRMSYGHLRSTIIGDALANLYRAEGFEVIRDNHIGDWGTQFGRLIVAMKRWGDEKELLRSKDPIGELQELYVKFHGESEKQTLKLRQKTKEKVEKEGVEAVAGLKEAIEDTSEEIMRRKKIGPEKLDMETIMEDALDRVVESDLEKEGREWFRKLEQGDSEARRLWKICVDLSLKEFDEIYQILGVGFEETLGESFYEDMLSGAIEEVKKSGAGKLSEGALVVDMKDKRLGVAIIQKSDGASVYMTRDLATAFHREREMGAGRAIYVVGEDQKLYFQQLFEILKRLGHEIGDNSVHVYFGMVRLPEGKMSTRKGRTVLLKDVIDEGIRRAGDVLEGKNPDLHRNKKLRDTVVRQIAVGALKWNDLSQDPRRPIVFDWDKALNLEGYSAPYVQYTTVRANSILEKTKVDTRDLSEFSTDSISGAYETKDERELVKLLAEFPGVVADAYGANNPSRVATYIYEVAQRFNSFYTRVPVLRAETPELVKSRLKLVAASSQVITNGLGILGIEVPKEM